MFTRVGILSAAHMHSYGYAAALKAHPNVDFVGIWDADEKRAGEFAERFEVKPFSDMPELLSRVDAVVVTSENTNHAGHAEAALLKGKHVLCEKPLVTTEEDGERMRVAAEKGHATIMTAFPCRYSPAYQKLKQRVAKGEIGQILSVCATNQGMCPFGWFVNKELSGGGAMIDHTVHVTDLLRDLLQSEPVEVYARSNSLMYGKDFDDVAFLHVTFDNGVFTTIDSSWSRPPAYKTWGNVRMNVVGEKGLIEMDMFSQAFGVYKNENMRHSLAGYGSDTDAALVADFITAIENHREPPITAHDGLQAARVAMAGYASMSTGQPVKL